MSLFTDHYLVLGLPTGEEGVRLGDRKITQAYEAKVEAGNASADVEESFKFLTDPQKRQEFNTVILNRQMQQAFARQKKRRALAWQKRHDLVQQKKQQKAKNDDETERKRQALMVKDAEIRKKRIADAGQVMLATMNKILQQGKDKAEAAEPKPLIPTPKRPAYSPSTEDATIQKAKNEDERKRQALMVKDAEIRKKRIADAGQVMLATMNRILQQGKDKAEAAAPKPLIPTPKRPALSTDDAEIRKKRIADAASVMIATMNKILKESKEKAETAPKTQGFGGLFQGNTLLAI